MSNLVFVLGSGRCGTKAIPRMLLGTPDLESHHEYCRYAYQREAVMYAMQRLDRNSMEDVLRNVYSSALYYSDASQFLDSSHKLVPVVDLLVDMFPDAKFIHIVRDGRKVSSSFYYKLQIHDSKSHDKFMRWVDDESLPVPPPSEKYWWIPAPYNLDRIQRIAWHWADSNTRISTALEKARNTHFIKLEEVTTNRDTLKGLIDFIGVDWSDSYWTALQKPDHAYVPINYSLTAEQSEKFYQIAAPLMDYYGYTGKEQDVRYYKV